MQDLKRGQIYYIENANAVGHQEQKTRPAVIVSNDKCNKFSTVVEMVLLTSKINTGKHLPTHVLINGCKYPSVAKCEAITPVNVGEIGQYIGKCTVEEIKALNKALLISLGMEVVTYYER